MMHAISPGGRVFDPEKPFVNVSALGVVSATLYVTAYVAQHFIAHAPPAIVPVATYGLATVGLFWCYATALRISTRPRLTRHTRAALIAAPVLASLALSLAPPTLSIDVFSYLAQGYEINQGGNPYHTPDKQVWGTSYGRELEAQGWLPVHGISPYGPAWLRVEAAAQGGAGDVPTQMRLLKVPLAAAGLLCAWLIWSILGVTDPGRQLLGTVMYLWNPLVVLEFAGDGHNDALMLSLLLIGLLLFVKRHEARGAAVIVGAALVKMSALLVAAPMAVVIIRQPADLARRLMRIVIACGVALAIGALLYGDLWIGAASFAGIRAYATATVTPSTIGVLFWYLLRTNPEQASPGLLSALSTGALVGYAAFASRHVRTVDTALKACARIGIAALLLNTAYWPWYVATPVALLSLSPTPRFLEVAFILSLFGRLAAPIDYLRINGLMDWPTETVVATLTGLWIPASILAAMAIYRRGRGNVRRNELAPNAHPSLP